MDNTQPPQTGNTTQGHCDCNQSYTTWSVTRELAESLVVGRPRTLYKYYWVCLNCGKRRLIGEWYVYNNW